MAPFPAPTPSVYPVREDSELLRDWAGGAPGLQVLEVGCGSGVAALAAARQGARVVASDLNPRALRAVRDAAHAEGVAVAPVRTDLANGLGRFDRILCNPPYLPTPPGARDPDRWVNLALDGGPDGLAVTRRLLETLPEHLQVRGAAVVLFSSRQGASRHELLGRWARENGTTRRVAVRRVGEEELELWELLLGPRGEREGSDLEVPVRVAQ